MTHLLHLDASARRASHSRSLSKKFAEQWRVVHPHGAYSYCFVLGAAAVYLLSRAMQDLPVGTAYAVFTGIGAIGAITLGVIVHKDPLSIGRFAALALIVGGVVLARITNPTED